MGRIKEWDAKTALERTAEVRELHFRGLSIHAIARQLRARESEIEQIVNIIQVDAYRSPEMHAFFENLQQRTMEHINALDAQLDIAYQALDHAREIVVATGGFGEPIKLRDPETGQETGKYATTYRNMAAVPKLLKQIEAISKQRAEVLKILNAKSDVTIKLQLTQNVQTTIMEFIQQLSEDDYFKLHRLISNIDPHHPGVMKTVTPARAIEG